MMTGESLKGLASADTGNRDWGREIGRFTQNFTMRQNHPGDPASHTSLPLALGTKQTPERSLQNEDRTILSLQERGAQSQPAEMEQIREASGEGPLHPLSHQLLLPRLEPAIYTFIPVSVSKRGVERQQRKERERGGKLQVSHLKVN